MDHAPTAEAVRRAGALADSGDLPGAARSLVSAGLAARAAALVDEALAGLAVRHEHAVLVAAVEALPPAERSLAARVAHADALVSRGTADTGVLQDLVEEAERDGDTGLAGLAAVALAEHLLLHGDPSGVFLAAQHLDRLPTEPLQRPAVLVARARLRRVLLWAKILLAPGQTDEAAADYRACLEDFRRAGRATDRLLTIVMFHGLRVAATWATTPGDRPAVTEARDQLAALGSPEVSWARCVVALMADSVGDAAAVREELAALLREEADAPAFPLVVTTHLDAIRALAESPDEAAADAAVRRLAEVADTVRRDYPVVIGGVLMISAHHLLDAGRLDDATEWSGRVEALPPFMPHEEHEREVMRCRLALLAAAHRGGPGAVPSAGEVTGRLDAAFDALVASGTSRMAAGLALRSALTARATGHPALADHLLSRADRLLPADRAERSAWERRWEDLARPVAAAAPRAADAPAAPHGAAPAGAAQPIAAQPGAAQPGTAQPGTAQPGTAQPGTAPHRLRLLTPVADVVVAGQTRRLPPALARIIAVLAALDRPVSTEQLADMLWPDADPAASRGRLKSALHRLRRLLEPADDLVRRDGDVWSLAPGEDWSVDLHEFHRLAAGDPADRAAALRLVDGLLWDVQLPYDEALAGLRAPLEVAWLRLADELGRAGVVPAEELRTRTAALGL
ncbi:hypothetical protein [Kineosporia sp. R_H_3]|uniref:hypothetical protein n=1 Tax=Kineosporia sp. R_H_3 TaxID=1961848 RepID=UPI000B4A89F9|nr:hypothetical protein [Kineosporia sp. R_H_3]